MMEENQYSFRARSQYIEAEQIIQHAEWYCQQIPVLEANGMDWLQFKAGISNLSVGAGILSAWLNGQKLGKNVGKKHHFCNFQGLGTYFKSGRVFVPKCPLIRAQIKL